MKKVGIVTDSTSCLPQELVDRHDICVVPLLIIIDGRGYRDGIDISPGEVYKIMRRKQNLPTTSTPSVGDFFNAFCQLSEKVESILCINVTAKQSKTFDTALVAREMAREKLTTHKIEVFDSQAASSALGWIVVEAARAAERGADLDETIEVVRKMMRRVQYLAIVDDLYYLARTGRIGKASAWASSLLNIKPIVGHDTSVGVTIPVDRSRTRAKAVSRLLGLMAERIGKSQAHVIVNHADELEEGKRLKEEIARRFNCAEIYLNEFMPSMGVHAGPGILGAAFYTDT